MSPEVEDTNDDEKTSVPGLIKTQSVMKKMIDQDYGFIKPDLLF